MFCEIFVWSVSIKCLPLHRYTLKLKAVRLKPERDFSPTKTEATESMRYKFFILLTMVLALLASCDKCIEKSLGMAGDNRDELESVLDCYMQCCNIC